MMKHLFSILRLALLAPSGTFPLMPLLEVNKIILEQSLYHLSTPLNFQTFRTTWFLLECGSSRLAVTGYFKYLARYITTPL